MAIEALRQAPHERNREFEHTIEDAQLEGLSIRIVRPPDKITNDHFNQFSLTNRKGCPFGAQQIEQTTGVTSRRITDMSVQKLGETAASGLIGTSENERSKINRVLVSTSYPSEEDRIPGLGHAETLAENFGLFNVRKSSDEESGDALDLHFACSTGSVIMDFLGDKGEMLVVGSEIYSPHFADPESGEDPSHSYTIFTDEAGTMRFRPGEDISLIASRHFKFPEELNGLIKMPINYDAIKKRAASWIKIPQPLREDGSLGKFSMDGYGVYRHMTGVGEQIKEMIEETERLGIDRKMITKIIPHQASLKMLESIKSTLGDDYKDLQEKFHIDIADGNSSSVSIMRSLGRAIRNKEVKKDDIVVLAGFGAGLYSSIQVIKLGRKD